jgi:hypothetical protein
MSIFAYHMLQVVPIFTLMYPYFFTTHASI